MPEETPLLSSDVLFSAPKIVLLSFDFFLRRNIKSKMSKSTPKPAAIYAKLILSKTDWQSSSACAAQSGSHLPSL